MIDSGLDDFKTTIQEALHIKNKKPKLNSQGVSFVLNFYWLYLDSWMN